MLFSDQQVAQRASNNFRGSPQVIKCQPFICTLGMRLKNRARASTINNAGYAHLAKQPHVGVERCAQRGYGFAKNGLAMLLQAVNQRFVTCQWLHGTG